MIKIIEEEWRQIPGFYPRYWVSNFGNVKSVYKHSPQLILKSYITPFGYKRIQIRKSNGGYKNVFVHVLVALAFIKNPKKKPFVNHKDSNRINNLYKNLEWSTRSENYLHGFKFGKMSNAGDRNPRSRLTEEQVLQIRKSKVFYKELAVQYGLTESGIQKIRHGHTWKHLLP